MMPVPAIPALAVFLGSIFSAIVTFLARFVTKRIAVVTAGIAAAVTVWLTFYAGVQSILSSIAVAFPAVALSQYSCFVPGNALPCLTAVMSAYLIRWIYDWKVRVISWQMKV